MALKKSKLVLLGTVLIFSSMALLLSNCGKKEEEKKVKPTYSSLYSEVFSKQCIECHRPSGSAYGTNLPNIDFTTSALGYSTMVGQNARGLTTTSVCGSNAKIIFAGSPSASYILATFYTDYGLGTSGWNSIGGCLPYSSHSAFQNATPDADGKAALVQWISEGAQNN